ncbi:hypothetical protein ACIQWA_36800 [Kitasatospora sp. NPDC098652]|uniref:hypothetical protein n=1 Tax=Kitasatospora sp. NPDC098652 TaxID=3364095 RepID=UPI0038221F96
MTTSPLSALPLPDPPDQAEAALHRARTAGEQAGQWVRELAGRQEDQRHGRVLERAAEAIERASNGEVVPGGAGRLTKELRYTLSADVLLGATRTGTLPELYPGERLALATACTVAAAMPGTALGDLPRELAILADELNAATAAGRTATQAGDARGLSAERPRLVLGHDHHEPLDQLAYRHVSARATEAFLIALHYQGREDPAAYAQAMHNALAVAADGVAAAALLRVADDPALGLDGDQWEYLHEVAGRLDLDTVENLTGANGDGLDDARPAEETG